MKKFSIIVPVYNEIRNLSNLTDRFNGIFLQLAQYRFEVILVNDGSIDDSLLEMKSLADKFEWLHFVDLSRNFGKEIAISAGLDHASDSNAIICIDADLQHPPELICDLISEWEKGKEVVVAVRKKTQKLGIFRRICSSLFYTLFDKLAEIPVVANSTDFRLLDIKVVRYMTSIKERRRLFRGLVDWLGFSTGYIYFDAPERVEGTVGYSYRKLINLALDSILSFSLTPLKFISLLGIFIFSGSLLLLTWMVFYVYFIDVNTYTPLAMFVVGNTMLSGIMLIAIGLVALYVAKIYSEVVKRPLYAVREIDKKIEKKLASSMDSNNRKNDYDSITSAHSFTKQEELKGNS